MSYEEEEDAWPLQPLQVSPATPRAKGAAGAKRCHFV